jgi:hypothetical protein
MPVQLSRIWIQEQSMRRLAWHVSAGLILAALLLAGCGGASPEAAADTIEAYLQARVESDVDRMTLLSCPDWEPQARVEAASFEAMNAVLEGVACQVASTSGDTALVDCQGKITTTYQGEAREWSVADHPYRAVRQEGEWRMCGYGE